jgi:thiosulfate/3-mercaptopyruvate sulfurtransferase
MLRMPSDEDLRARLQKLAFPDDSRIVVYYGKDLASPSTRGVSRCNMRDCATTRSCSTAAWAHGARRRSAEQGRRIRTAGKLSALLHVQPIVVDREYVRTHVAAPGVTIVDGRATAYYDGVEVGGAHGQRDKVGHIKGARSVPFTEITDERLMLKSQAELQALFDRAGVAPGDTVTGYCHIGQQATAMLFAARLLGHPVPLC